MNDGPGQLDINDFGGFTIAKSYKLDARKIMAYAASINDTNDVYFDDTRADRLSVHPAICFALQWNTRFRPDLPANPRAAPFGVHAETDLRPQRRQLRAYQPSHSGPKTSPLPAMQGSSTPSVLTFITLSTPSAALPLQRACRISFCMAVPPRLMP